MPGFSKFLSNLFNRKSKRQTRRKQTYTLFEQLVSSTFENMTYRPTPEIDFDTIPMREINVECSVENIYEEINEVNIRRRPTYQSSYPESGRIISRTVDIVNDSIAEEVEELNEMVEEAEEVNEEMIEKINSAVQFNFNKIDRSFDTDDDNNNLDGTAAPASVNINNEPDINVDDHCEKYEIYQNPGNLYLEIEPFKLYENLPTANKYFQTKLNDILDPLDEFLTIQELDKDKNCSNINKTLDNFMENLKIQSYQSIIELENKKSIDCASGQINSDNQNETVNHNEIPVFPEERAYENTIPRNDFYNKTIEQESVHNSYRPLQDVNLYEIPNLPEERSYRNTYPRNVHNSYKPMNRYELPDLSKERAYKNTYPRNDSNNKSINNESVQDSYNPINKYELPALPKERTYGNTNTRNNCNNKLINNSFRPCQSVSPYELPDLPTERTYGNTNQQKSNNFNKKTIQYESVNNSNRPLINTYKHPDLPEEWQYVNKKSIEHESVQNSYRPCRTISPYKHPDIPDEQQYENFTSIDQFIKKPNLKNPPNQQKTNFFADLEHKQSRKLPKIPDESDYEILIQRQSFTTHTYDNHNLHYVHNETNSIYEIMSPIPRSTSQSSLISVRNYENISDCSDLYNYIYNYKI